jgi:hypothetical protein
MPKKREHESRIGVRSSKIETRDLCHAKSFKKAGRRSFNMAACIRSCAPFWRTRIPLRPGRNWTRTYWRDLDIPFPRSVRHLLLAEGLAEEHHWVQNSGWITFQMRSESEEALGHARWLMRLSYLRYALKTASEPRKLFEGESEQLRLSPEFQVVARTVRA